MTVIDLGRIVSDKNVPKIFLKRDVVQWIECVVWDHEVAGLSPVIPTPLRAYHSLRVAKRHSKCCRPCGWGKSFCHGVANETTPSICRNDEKVAMLHSKCSVFVT